MRRWFSPSASTLGVRNLALELLVAWCLAFIVWLYMHSRAHQSIDHIQLPIALQLAPGLRDQFTLDVSNVPKATVSFSGPNSRMRELRRKLARGLVQAVLTYTIPEDKQKESTFSDVVRLEGASLTVPPGILVEWNDLNVTIPLTVYRLAERTLPVKLDATGDVRVSNIKIEPATVVVRGPKVVLDRAQAISTLPVELTPPADEEAKEFHAKEAVGLVGELDGRPVTASPAQIQFKCKVQPRKRVYEIADVPIRFALPDRYPWQARFDGTGGKVTLRVIGPAGEEAPRARAYIDLDQEAFGRGRNVGPVRIELPKEFELVERRTPMAAFYLEDRDVIQHDTARPTLGLEARPTSNQK
jgi:hypothetical protein